MEGNLWLYRLYFRVVILLWLPVSLSAVDLPNLTFRTITISDGLSNNIINTIYKDKRGFIWLGTQTGLDRFDGINVKSFRLSLKPWGIALKFLFLHHENILFPND